MKSRLPVLFPLLLIFMAVSLNAQETATSWGVDFAYYTDDHEGLDSGSFIFPDYDPAEKPVSGYTYPAGDSGRDLGSGWGAVEAQAWFKHSLSMPFLAGTGPLTAGNNLKLTVRGNLAPVIAGVTVTAVLTPLAVLQVEAGAHLGTGWAALGFNGMGMNSDGTGIPGEDSFAGIVTRNWLGATFQFDLAAVIPGEWNHVVMLANGRFEYQNYSAASNGESWMYESDSGENFNGFRYLGTYLLGYQMPLRVNTVGLLFETEERLGDIRRLSPMSSGWGSDFVSFRIAPVMILDLTENSSVTLLFQFTNALRYTPETIYNSWFQNRTVDDDAVFWKFRRIAFSYEMKL